MVNSESDLFLDFAPMEGITTAAFRSAHRTVFGCVDHYYSPFLNTGRAFLSRTRDRRDIDPVKNNGVPLIPQLLANDSHDFLTAAAELAGMGYREINLNLGCPSATVVTRHKGAGFLKDPDELDEFLEGVFDGLSAISEAAGFPLRVSVKTRLGLSDPEEAYSLMTVYNRYPLSLLIIHPRVRAEFYSGSVHMDIFKDMCRESKNPVCYNGDILTVSDVKRIRELCTPAGIMIGRGAVRNPALFRMIRAAADDQKSASTSVPTKSDTAAPSNNDTEISSKKDTAAPSNNDTKTPSIKDTAMPSRDELRCFLQLLLSNTAQVIREEKNQLSKMKDVWVYLGTLFQDSSRPLKKIMKASHFTEYQAAVEELLTHEISPA